MSYMGPLLADRANMGSLWDLYGLSYTETQMERRHVYLVAHIAPLMTR